MQWIGWSIMILLFTGLGAWAVRGRDVFSGVLGAGGCVAAGATGLWGAGNSLLLRQIETRRELWNAPYGSMNVGIDSLSALFLIPAFLVGATAALSALRRLPGDYAANRPREHWLFFNVTLAAAVLAVVARNAVLFLFAWETMAVGSFLLIENDQRGAGARTGGWTFLVVSHLGGLCLFAMFALLGGGGRLDFSALTATGARLSAAFVLAFAGFGAGAGLAPFHAWYARSVAAAPAHVGALLSGVVGGLGIYGLARFLTLAGGGGEPPRWWGGLLLAAGLASALLGAARSLAARDLPALLAWSSAGNYGLMAAGLGTGLLGAALGNGLASFLGFAGACLHMLTHAVGKGLLHLVAGSIRARAGTREFERMGGFLTRLPRTAALFLLGGIVSAAIPPLSAFAGEFALFAAAPAVSAGAIAAALTAGVLAIAAYARAFGLVFLGKPRGPGGASAAGERPGLLVPHCVLAVCALAAAALSPHLLNVVGPAGETLARLWRNVPAGVLAAEIRGGAGAGAARAAMAGTWVFAACLTLVLVVRFKYRPGKQR